MFSGIAKRFYRGALRVGVSILGQERLFTGYFRFNRWRNSESASGDGSSLQSAQHLITTIPELMREFGCQSILDAPCGDFHWAQHMNIAGEYIGADIVRPLIERNHRKFGGPRRRFMHADIQESTLPEVDLILCRDALVHFSYRDVWKAIENFKRSKSTYLLTTTFPDCRNADIPTGDWRGLNLEEAPFNFPHPLRRIQEFAPPPFQSKQLGLWRIGDLPNNRH